MQIIDKFYIYKVLQFSPDSSPSQQSFNKEIKFHVL